jgi:hypothetical protein
MIKLTTTSESITHVKAVIYGESGVGKTWLCQTAPKPVIISAEKGLLTLQDVKIPVIEIASLEDLEDAYRFLMENEKGQARQTICLDSISDIAETILAHEKELAGKDPRQAYGAYADKLLPLIKKFRDIEGRHVYFTAKMKRITDDFTGITQYGPSAPGQQIGGQLPYMFDFCLVLRIGIDEEDKKFRYLQTESDVQYIAKDRSGKLDSEEPPDLTHIFNKALGQSPRNDKPEIVLKKKKEEAKEEVVEEEKALEVEGDFDEEAKSEEIVEEVEESTDEVVDEVAKAAEDALTEED